jgi:hypothetical protein
MLTPGEIDRIIEQRALKAEALTPAHSAAEAAMGGEDDDEGQAEELRRRIQHQAEPYPLEVPEVAEADLGKRYSQAWDAPSGYPPLRQVSAEEFRRGPVTAGEAAYGVNYEPPARPVAVPSATLDPGMISRPLLTAGQSLPCAPGGA